MTPSNQWLERWEQNRNMLESPTDLNTYYTRSEIAGRKLMVLCIGDCTIPTGQVLVRDPLVYLGHRAQQPYFKSIPTGTWQTELCVVTPDNESECARYAAARICFSTAPAVGFEEALIGNEDSFFGFVVDAGLGCICDEGLCEGEIVLDEWNDLFDTEEPYTLSFAMDTHHTLTEFSDLQKAGYDHLIKHQEKVAEAILAALLHEYPTMQEDYGYNETEKAELMPDAADTDALAELLSPNSVIIHPVARDGLPYIGYEFGCPWDEEHGFGAMLHGTRIVQIGGSDTAILTWIAQDDLEQDQQEK